MPAPLLFPFAAYRRDREAAGKEEPFSSHDGIWLVIASFLDNIGILPPEIREEVLLSQARVLTGYARAAAVVGGALSPDHPFHWAAELGAALVSNHEARSDVVDQDAAAGVVERMAGAMVGVGAVELARVVLEAAQRALPYTSPAAMVQLSLQRGRVVALLGDEDGAHRLFTLARNVAAEAKLRDLVAVCDGERSLLPPRRAPAVGRRRGARGG